ncbi:hypothetical protein A143_09315 [Vibrio splendidus ZS-139]|nr:hypothetical protein A143_09315 [Vibrio splendidus ZS-139]
MKYLISVVLTLFPISSLAMVDEYQLEQLIGWTLLESKQIEGYITESGERSDDFEGCDFDMRVLFTDGKAVTCNSYGYQYAFMPKALIFGKSVNYKGKQFTLYKMLVQGQLYDIN